MCDYSLHGVRSRRAKVGDRLVTHNFNTGACGFAALGDWTTAVCVLPGTELVFSKDVVYLRAKGLFWRQRVKVQYQTAIFRKVNTDQRCTHHDALEFPVGQIALLTSLCAGQNAIVLQLGAEQKTLLEDEAQKYFAFLDKVQRIAREPSDALSLLGVQ
jgi:hypothetical protein